jgi:serine/threonine protein kinase
MELTVQNVYGLLLRSKLLPVDEAKAVYTRWHEEAGKECGNLARFTGWLVGHQYLTDYQVAMLARGHADHFFLDDYKILDRLGKGRMAGVYKAQHRLGQVVAIKVLPPSKAREANLLARFHREARLALRLKHPNIVRAFQTGVAKGLNYLVMEYLEGEPLDEVLQRRGRLPPAEAVRLIHQALEGLQHIHTQGLVHRDLKPANLMLLGATPDTTQKATVKILDIGLGRTFFEEGTSEQVPEPGLTGEGVILGTPDYMAPEQARDPRQASIRSDIYSFGCVLYHLLTGQPPFPDTNVISQMIRHATEEPRPLREFNPAVPDGLQQILQWMMAKDPAQRYPTPERAAGALQIFLAAGAEPASTLEADPNMKPYLSWLEGQPAGDAAATRIVAPSTLPSVQMPADSIPAKTDPGKSRSRSRDAAGRRRRKGRKSTALPGPGDGPPTVLLPKPAAPAQEVTHIDVEPVAVPEAAPIHGTLGRRLSRRDLAIFGIGTLAGAAATFFGCLAALKYSKNHGQPPPEDGNR